MGKRGPKPKKVINFEWSSGLAYAVGLLVTDGSLSKDGRHIVFVSKDIEQLTNFSRALGNREFNVDKTKSGYTGQYVPRIQFSDVALYRFLLGIGLTPNKTKTIGKVLIPKEYFFDFLRGHHDGDGYFYSYFDPRWPKSFMYYLVFLSSSKRHIEWIRSQLKIFLGVSGHITQDQRKTVYNLKYAKKEGLQILKKMYDDENPVCLSRKKLKIIEALGKIGQCL